MFIPPELVALGSFAWIIFCIVICIIASEKISVDEKDPMVVLPVTATVVVFAPLVIVLFALFGIFISMREMKKRYLIMKKKEEILIEKEYERLVLEFDKSVQE